MTTQTQGTTRRGGIGFGSLLALLFIALKLTGTIHWSWLWVLAPFWVPWAIVLVVLGAIAILTAIKVMVK